jgi:hypothetical protein
MHRSGLHHIGWREFSFSHRSPLTVSCAHEAHFGFKGNPYDNGIPLRIQRRTISSIRIIWPHAPTELELLPTRNLRLIMA